MQFFNYKSVLFFSQWQKFYGIMIMEKSTGSTTPKI